MDLDSVPDDDPAGLAAEATLDSMASIAAAPTRWMSYHDRKYMYGRMNIHRRTARGHNRHSTWEERTTELGDCREYILEPLDRLLNIKGSGAFNTVKR